MIINPFGGGPINLQDKLATVSASQQIITPDKGYDGLSKVTINGASLQTKTITAGLYSDMTVTPDEGYFGLNRVKIQPKIQHAQIPNREYDDTDASLKLSLPSNYDFNFDQALAVVVFFDLHTYYANDNINDSWIVFAKLIRNIYGDLVNSETFSTGNNNTGVSLFTVTKSEDKKTLNIASNDANKIFLPTSALGYYDYKVLCWPSIIYIQ